MWRGQRPVGLLATVFVVMVCSCAAPAPPGPPVTKSELAVQTVTYACTPLRAEFTVGDEIFVRGCGWRCSTSIQCCRPSVR
jgi:hypothetical protein